MKKTYKIFIILAFLLLISATHIYASSVVMDLESNNINSNINQNINNSIYNTNENNLITSNTSNENNVDNFNEFSQNNIADNTIDNSITSNSSTVQTSNPVVTTTSSNNDDFFTVENILSVSIIVIGVLLIFLSIAILIRCKN